MTDIDGADPQPREESDVPIQRFPARRRGTVRRIVEPTPAPSRTRASYAEVAPAERPEAPEQRWNHGQEIQPAIAPRFPDRVASGIATLRKNKLIGDADVTSAKRWTRDYICGIEGVRDSEPVMRAKKSDVHDAMLARADAITRHREIAEIIGAGRTQWLNAFLAEELSFVAMAARFLPDRTSGRTEMIGHLSTLLTVLTGLYATIDRKRPKTAA